MAETVEERNRLKAVLEVVESEKTYVKDLRTMIEVRLSGETVAAPPSDRGAAHSFFFLVLISSGCFRSFTIRCRHSSRTSG
jgi:hypothetical protein